MDDASQGQVTRPRRELRWQQSALTLLALVSPVLPLLGCNKSSGVDRFDLSGKITFQGQPVARGYIVFRPDKSAGNSGPGANANIMDGEYSTMAGQGVVGGPHVVKITGTDGVEYKTPEGITIPIGRRMFADYETKMDLPKETGTFDIEVPAEQGEKLKKK